MIYAAGTKEMPSNDKGIKHRIKPYFGAGVSQYRVAKELDCSPVAINRALRRMGLDCKVFYKDETRA